MVLNAEAKSKFHGRWFLLKQQGEGTNFRKAKAFSPGYTINVEDK